MLAKAIVEIHSSGTILEQGMSGRQKSERNKELLERQEERDDIFNAPFTLVKTK